MDGRYPGKRLVERLERRTVRRPRIGLSPAFYARFGLADPWLELGEGATDEQAEEAFSFVSARPFYQTMRRLALARWRRQRRERQWASRIVGTRTAARRRFPGESSRPTFFGVRTLGMSDMALPEPWIPPEYAEAGQAPSSAWGTASGAAVRVRSGADAWITSKGAPARVAEPLGRAEYVPSVPFLTRRLEPLTARALAPSRLAVSRAADRPAERVGRRLAQAATGRDPLRRALAEASFELHPASRRKVETVLRRTEHLEERVRVIEVRRVLQRIVGARVLRTVMQEAPEATVGARPTEVARGRAAPQRRRRRGLRPVLGSSPSMEVITHDEAQTQGASPWASPSAKPSQTAHAGARVVRGQQVQPQLSTSPVVRTPRSVRGPDRLAPSPVPSTAVGSSARIVRTETGAYTRARAFRKTTTPVAPSSSVRTARREDPAARVHRTATGDLGPSGTFRTPEGEFVGARSGQTTAGDWTGSRSLTTRASAHAAARAMRTAATGFVGATSAVTSSSSIEQSRAVKTDKGIFTAARSTQTADGEWIGARTSTWAAERLATTGTPAASRGSLLPRMAPRVDTGTLLAPLVVESVEEATKLARRLKAERPHATVKVVEKPWRAVPYQPAATFKTRRSPAQKAADRAVEVPLVGEAAARAASSTWAAPVAPRSADAAERRLRGPVAYASVSPARDAHVIQPDVPREETERGPGFHRTASRRHAPTRGVRTDSGDFVGATSHRTQSRPRSAADWSPSVSAPSPGMPPGPSARRMRTGGGLWMPTETWLTQSGEFAGARSGRTASTPLVGARLGETRPMDWVGARVAVGATDAYRGAFARSFRTQPGQFVGAGVWQTPNAPWVSARRGAGLGRPDMITPDGIDRPQLHDVMAESQRGVPMKGAPGWAERATVPDRLRSTTELVAGLVRATDPREIIEIILTRGNELKSSTLPRPVVQVIEQIRASAHGADVAERRSGARRPSSARAVRTGAGRARRSARVVSGWTGLKPKATAATSGAIGDDKVSKLAKKLRNLIHLAESSRTGDALREARLAHADRPDSRMTEGGDISNAESAAMASVDIEALGREVLEVVVRELELRQERRQEDNDGNIWW
ncbi:MAG TPA: hypothetical protein QGF58_14265 [Myxococcota bacterium]|nr:hypothetical protein [Myxococcota bacterium]